VAGLEGAHDVILDHMAPMVGWVWHKSQDLVIFWIDEDLDSLSRFQVCKRLLPPIAAGPGGGNLISKNAARSGHGDAASLI
jgi:hypothetical protein